MEKINDGGPAFPYEHFREVPQFGMALRDYFAAKAMAGICAHTDTWGLGSVNCVAKEAYRIADAMLKAREVKS